MKSFTVTGYRLSRMPGALRLILALYCLTTLAGFWVSGLVYVVRETHLPGGALARYAPPDGGGLLAPPRGQGLDLLVDVTHPHLFSVPLVLLVLCHLVQLCQVPQWVKTTLYLAAFGGLFTTFGAPWVLRYAPVLAPAVIAGGTLLVLSGTALCLLPLRELVFPRDEAA